ncbi:MAG: cation diffusion facilitator family transporter [Haloarculaceae archaeon]
MASNSVGVVVAALIANGAIAILKFGGFLLTGSPSMLAETYHSVSDTGNQVFLLVGIFYGRRERDRRHPFGYGKAQFFYSFLVSVMLFGIAGWESAKHGYHAITHGESAAVEGTLQLLGTSVPGVYVNYAVLAGGIVFEGYALIKARAAMRQEIEEHDYDGYVDAFRKTSQTTILTALTEDTIALVGLVTALVGIVLTRATGNPIFDAAGALFIGLMLMGFAVALAWENKRLILGESLTQTDERKVRETIEGHPDVREIVDLRTVYFGPNDVMVAGDVAFADGLTTDELDAAISTIEDDLRALSLDIVKIYLEPERSNP